LARTRARAWAVERSVWETVDAHGAVGAARIRGRCKIGATVGIGAVVGLVLGNREIATAYRDRGQRRIAFQTDAHDQEGKNKKCETEMMLEGDGTGTAPAACLIWAPHGDGVEK